MPALSSNRQNLPCKDKKQEKKELLLLQQKLLNIELPF